MRVMLAAAFMLSAAFSGLPAKAAGVSICTVQATVTLNTVENLLSVNGGEGTISGRQICQGSISGDATNFGGGFSFCMHKTNGTHDNAIVPGSNPPRPYCSNLAAQPVTDAAHTGVATASQTATQGNSVVAHINASLSFVAGGLSCNFGLLGHSDLILADLNLTGFKCNTGFGQPSGAEIARAQATAAIQVDPTLTSCPPGPNGQKACFQLLQFAGVIELVDQT